MRINVLQHTSNEGPGAIALWAQRHHHDLYVYHPDQFGLLPTIDQTDLLVILGGPMNPHDDLDWLPRERTLISQALDRDRPIFGACLGAQQISLVLGGQVTTAPAKEVGWAPVTRQSTVIPGIPAKLNVLHWHQDTFSLPAGSTLLFSSQALTNQGFLYGHHVIGLQFHFEPLTTNVREMVINDRAYIAGSVLHQSAAEILATPVPTENQTVLFRLLDYITLP